MYTRRFKTLNGLKGEYSGIVDNSEMDIIAKGIDIGKKYYTM